MNWRKNTVKDAIRGEHIPIPLNTLLAEGGTITKRVGVSNRAIVRMPDGTVFEQGLEDDACYVK